MLIQHYRVAVKAGLYRKAIQVCIIPTTVTPAAKCPDRLNSIPFDLLTDRLNDVSFGLSLQQNGLAESMMPHSVCPCSKIGETPQQCFGRPFHVAKWTGRVNDVPFCLSLQKIGETPQQCFGRPFPAAKWTGRVNDAHSVCPCSKIGETPQQCFGRPFHVAKWTGRVNDAPFCLSLQQNRRNAPTMLRSAFPCSKMDWPSQRCPIWPVLVAT